MRAFWLLVLVPLAFAGYLAVRVSTDDAAFRRHQLQNLLDGRLGDVRTRTHRALAQLEGRLADQLAGAPLGGDDLRDFARRLPLARAAFRIDARGRLVFPGGVATEDERAFLERTAAIWSGHAIVYATNDARRPDATAQRATARRNRSHGDSLLDLAAQREHGWLTWYWAEGLHLLFWRRAPAGVVGIEVERIGLLSEIVAALPTATDDDGKLELVDSRGETVHQWGTVDDRAVTPPDATLPLEAPLETWQLRYTMSPAQRTALAGDGGPGWLLGLAAIAIAIVVLAAYVYREYTRRLREAAQRVGFVTRVSHELRTPLANIRMYSELLEEHADDEDQVRRARVIVTESHRLGRLIDNVLAFARHQRGTLATRVDAVALDPIVREAVAAFEPSLAARGIAVCFELGDPPRVRAAADAVEQIVANLLSNVEKYAAAGGQVTVATYVRGDRAVVAIADRGPGVPAADREAIFEPFHRAADSLTGASGTGIGLAIARELARAAGGELALGDSDSGARFELAFPLAGDPV